MTNAVVGPMRRDSIRVAAIAASAIVGVIAMHSLISSTAAPGSSGPHHHSHGSNAALHGVAGVCLLAIGALALTVITTPGRSRPIRRPSHRPMLPGASAFESSSRPRFLELKVIRV